MPGPYTPDPDDFTAPLDADWASIGAAEFRALKEKLTNFFSTSGINLTDNTYFVEHGIYFINENVSNAGVAARGISVSVKRTGGDGSVIGGQFSGGITNALTLQADQRAHGGYSVFNTQPGSYGGVQGIEGHRIDVVQEESVGQSWTKGLGIKLFNRAEGEANVQAFGNDSFNKNSVAIFIEAQAPTVAHSEKLGWSRGIRFHDNALAEESGDGVDDILVACALDFSGLAAYRGTRQPVSFNFHQDQLMQHVALNSGTYVPPTAYAGVIPVTFDNDETLWWGIPIIDLTPPP